jgi:hypothetical protein
MTRVHDGVFGDALDHTYRVSCFVFPVFAGTSNDCGTRSIRLNGSLVVVVYCTRNTNSKSRVPGRASVTSSTRYRTREIMFAILRDIDNLRVAHHSVPYCTVRSPGRAPASSREQRYQRRREKRNLRERPIPPACWGLRSISTF